jgi:hypothetical protein
MRPMRKLLFISKLLFCFATLNARDSGVVVGGVLPVSNENSVLKTIVSNVLTVLPSLTVCPNDLVNVEGFARNNGVEKALKWENSNSGIGLGSGGVGEMPKFVAVNPTGENIVATINYQFVQSNGHVATFNFNVIVRPKPIVFLNAVNATVCNGTPYNQSLAYASKGSTFGFTNDNPSVNFTKNITCEGLNVTPSMTKLTPQIANISITPILNGCSGAPQFLQMAVLPNPLVVQPNDHEVCSGESISVVFKGLFVGMTFHWTNDNPSVNMPLEGAGNIENQTVTNFTGVYQVANITVIPHFNGCDGASKRFKIVVKPAPILATSAFSFCVNDSAHIELKTNLKAALATTFSWSSSNSTTGMPMNGDAATIDFLTTSTIATEIITSYLTVLITADGCHATTQVAVNIKPRPVLLNPGNLFINGGQNVDVHFLSNVEGANVDWTSDKNAIGLQPIGAGDLRFLSAMNTSKFPITVNITATPNFKGCAEQSQMFAITLLPTPSVSTPFATVPNKVNK